MHTAVELAAGSSNTSVLIYHSARHVPGTLNL